MPVRIEQPTPTVQQVSGNDPDGRYILSVLVKVTYALSESGAPLPAPEQIPLVTDLVLDPKDDALILDDLDTFAFKPRTDIVVKGHAHGRGRPQFSAAITVGTAAFKQFAVFGDRSVRLRANGSLEFTQPRPTDKVPLTFASAFGGRDTVNEAEARKNYDKVSPPRPSEFRPGGPMSAFLYPRNPSGKGYLVAARSEEAVDAVELPNLEDPADLLTPQRLPVNVPLHWPKMPLPWAAGWVHYGTFPRICGAAGMCPPYDGNLPPFAEITRGLVPEQVIRPGSLDNVDPFYLTNGAALGLSVPYLRGDEIVVLDNLHPAVESFKFALPPVKPRIFTDGRNGKFNKTSPVLHTLLIEPDQNRFSLVWRGSAPALRPYMEEELKTMPLKVEWL